MAAPTLRRSGSDSPLSTRTSASSSHDRAPSLRIQFLARGLSAQADSGSAVLLPVICAGIIEPGMDTAIFQEYPGCFQPESRGLVSELPSSGGDRSLEKARRSVGEAATLLAMKVHAKQCRHHVLIETDPRWVPAEFVGKIKANIGGCARGISAPSLSTGETLSRSYFCATVGATIRRYIEAQKGR
jgi:hypothetical protein